MERTEQPNTERPNFEKTQQSKPHTLCYGMIDPPNLHLRMKHEKSDVLHSYIDVESDFI